MPKVLVLNPNTTAAMTRSIAAFARSVAAPTTQIVGRNPQTGAASIEGPYDHALCMQPLLEEVVRGERDGCDATIIACFDDPGVTAARCLVAGPVIGIAQAAMQGAALIAARFAVITTVNAAAPVIEDLVVRYGASRSCVAVRAAGVPVLGLAAASAACTSASASAPHRRCGSTVPTPSSSAAPACPHSARASRRSSACR